MTDKTFGFIILRHVNSSITNTYWIRCYDSIRKYYPENTILIIDDNSNQNIIHSRGKEKILYNTHIINSEYPQRGELLPYFYYLNNKLFDIAIIIHDSVFINKYIPIEDIQVDKYNFLWDFEHDWDQEGDELRIIERFNNNKELIDFHNNKNLWKGCFGCMSIITHDYLTYINSKYDISKILDSVLTRYNRCSFERVIACMLQLNGKCEGSKSASSSSSAYSLLGNIHSYCPYGISINEIDKYSHLPIIKVWTGR
jgi:hypothetical protein